MTDTKQVRAYLWRVRDAERELKLLEQEYEQAKADILHLKAIQYDADKVSGGKIGDLSDAITALEGYAERVNAQWDVLVNLREEAKNLIARIIDWRCREVLTRRYLRGQTLERIAVDLGYSYRQVKRIHRGAMCQIQKDVL